MPVVDIVLENTPNGLVETGQLICARCYQKLGGVDG